MNLWKTRAANIERVSSPLLGSLLLSLIHLLLVAAGAAGGGAGDEEETGEGGGEDSGSQARGAGGCGGWDLTVRGRRKVEAEERQHAFTSKVVLRLEAEAKTLRKRIEELQAQSQVDGERGEEGKEG